MPMELLKLYEFDAYMHVYVNVLLLDKYNQNVIYSAVHIQSNSH